MTNYKRTCSRSVPAFRAGVREHSRRQVTLVSGSRGRFYRRAATFQGRRRLASHGHASYGGKTADDNLRDPWPRPIMVMAPANCGHIHRRERRRDPATVVETSTKRGRTAKDSAVGGDVWRRVATTELAVPAILEGLSISSSKDTSAHRRGRQWHIGPATVGTFPISMRLFSGDVVYNQIHAMLGLSGVPAAGSAWC